MTCPPDTDLEALSEAEVFAHWRRVAEDVNALGAHGRWAAPEDLGAYFQLFRPAGEGLAPALRGLRRGAEHLARLGRIYEVAGEHVADAYFVVRRPVSRSDVEVAGLARGHLELVVHAARALGEHELVVPRWEVALRRGEEARAAIDDDSLDMLAHEVVGDWLQSLEPEPSHALLLTEALYLIACSYDLAHHVLWPLYRRAAGLDDPLGPAVELWAAGADLRLVEPGRADIFVPA